MSGPGVPPAGLQRHAQLAGGLGAGRGLTLLHIGPRETAIVSGSADAPPAVVVLALGTADAGRGAFRSDPPTPLELENAIEAIEDAVMPLARRLPAATVLVLDGAAASAIARAAGRRGAGVTLALPEVEQLFRDLAAVALGRPAASSGLPPGAGFAASLLILRECMHHLGFASVQIGEDAAGG